MEIYFVLVEPLRAENIGAAARAINTMGFSHLRFVKPSDYMADRARFTAHGSVDLLENAEVFDSLSDAVKDMDYIIGTTASHRNLKKHYHDGDELAELIRNHKDNVRKVAIVFGRECSGLTNEEFTLCDIVSSIPQAKSYPTMNLGQSVMVYSYLLSSLGFTTDEESSKREPNSGQFSALKIKIQEILRHIDVGEDNRSYKKTLGRMGELGFEDIQLLHYLCDKIHRKLEIPEDSDS